MSREVAVIDYGMGNIHSVDKALKFVSPNDKIRVVHDPQAVANADRVVFPGVGAIRDCISALREKGLDEALRQAVKEKPVLAICVGMQALFGSNEEFRGGEGLGILEGEVKRLPNHEDGIPIKVPQIGWNKVHAIDHPLYANIPQGSYFFFVHSYYCQVKENSISAAKSLYGLEFDAAALSGNIFATQFHPEKSHKDGLQLLKNFFNWEGDTN